MNKGRVFSLTTPFQICTGNPKKYTRTRKVNNRYAGSKGKIIILSWFVNCMISPVAYPKESPQKDPLLIKVYSKDTGYFIKGNNYIYMHQ